MEKQVILLYVLLLGISITSKAGDAEPVRGKGQFGLTYSSFGSNDLISFQKTMGGPGYHSDGFESFGLNYIYKLNRTVDFETGIEYSRYKIIVEPDLPLIYGGTPYSAKFSLIQIPVTVRLNFLKYFFVNGGVFLDIGGAGSKLDVNQNGLGANFGLGIKYDLSPSLSLFVNPYVKIHSLLPFTSTLDFGRLYESGFRFGIMGRLTK